MLNRIIDYLISLILVIALCYVAWVFKEKSTFVVALFGYMAVLFALMPFHNVKYIGWIVDIMVLPLCLFRPLVHNLKIVITTAVGIFFFYLCIYGAIRACSSLGIANINQSLALYLSLTISFIFATQKWAGKIIDKTTNRYHSEYNNMKYQPCFAQYLIYVFYLIILFISNVRTFASTSNNTGTTSILLASFATFVAYDRLISNKRLLEDSKLLLKASEIKDTILGNKNSDNSNY